jgi:hypothetical protein
MNLVGRYLSFVWMFEPVPVGAPLLERAAIVRRNRERGLRYLPVYMRRYLWLLAASVSLGVVFELMSVPLVCGAFFTCSTMSATAFLIASVGLAGMRLRAFGYRDF